MTVGLLKCMLTDKQTWPNELTLGNSGWLYQSRMAPTGHSNP